MTFSPPPFPKILSYRGEADPLHHVRKVVCLEKIDGTNTRVGVPRGACRETDLIIGGRELLEGEPNYSQPVLGELWRRDARLCAALFECSSRLDHDFTLYGETCGGRIQSMGFLYGSRPHFLLFAAQIGGVWLGYRTSLPAPPSDSDDGCRTSRSPRSASSPRSSAWPCHLACTKVLPSARSSRV